MASDNVKFTVLEGGLSKTLSSENLTFRSAWITDTRLMGVVCMLIHWHLDDDSPYRDFHQFFYFDVEEMGFDRFEWVFGSDKEELAKVEASMIGGLGGTKVMASQKEAVYLLKKYVRFNEEHSLELPDGEDKYNFMLTMDGDLTASEIAMLFDKSCIEPASKSELANYFIMRCFARDFECAAYLSDNKIGLDLFPDYEPCTLYKNDLKFKHLDNTCLCESLIGNNEEYHIVRTELDFHNMRVSGYRKVSDMKISDTEAYMILSHSEFVTIYDYSGLPEQFNRDTSKLTKNSMILDEHGGKTFMIFYPDNGHVASKSYRLYNDLLGIYHLTGSNQLIVSASSLNSIRKLEVDLTFSTVYTLLELKDSYEFNEPVLMQYLESDFSNFEDFISAIKLD